jgi:hypothetical protein
MHAAVRLFGVVRTLFVFTLQKTGFKQISELVPDGCRVLVAQQGRMQLVNVTLRKWAVAFYKLKKAFQHISMILNDSGNYLRWLLARMVANEVSVYATLDQRLRDSAINVVHAFDLAGLNRPLTAEALIEFSESAALLEVGALIVPELEQRTEFSIS